MSAAEQLDSCTSDPLRISSAVQGGRDVQRLEVGSGPHGPDPCVLLLEDNAFISMAIEEDLRDAGFAVVVFSACDPALAWLRDHMPDAGVLDVSLGDETCLKVAQLLHRRNVPFLVATGRDSHEGLLPGFEDVTWLQKPFHTDVLLGALHDILPQQNRGLPAEV